MNKLENTRTYADIISRGTRDNGLNVGPAKRANMSAEQKIDSCQQPRSPAEDPRRIESSGRSSFSPGQSITDSHPINQLLACLRSVPCRLLSCLSSFAVFHIDTISDNDWRSLLKRCERVARNEIEYQYWRDVEDGLLPSGYDASSIAAQAIAEFFEDREAKALIRTLPAL